MDIITVVRDYGWVGLIVLYFGPKLWTFLTDRLYPQRVAERRREQDRRDSERKREQDRQDSVLQAEREARALLLKSQIEREERESTHRQAIDNRVATAIENIGAAIQQTSLAVTVGNERITQLISAHSRHDNFTFTSHEELKDKLGQIELMIDTRKQVEDLREGLRETQEKIKTIKHEKSEGE